MTVEMFEPDDGQRMFADLQQRAASIDSLAVDVMSQANRLFPQRTQQSMFLKMYSELGELAEATTFEQVSEEGADILIMVLDYLKVQGVDIGKAVRAKMAINEARKWERTNLGAFRHVK